MFQVNSTRDMYEQFWFRLRWRLNRIQEYLHGSYFRSDYKNIPIIINSFNQLTYLSQLIDRLEHMGYHNIHVINNGSSYPPLLEYYKSLKHPVYTLDQNLGFEALWKSEVFKAFKRDYYVYTDADVIPIADCPDNFLQYFLDIMERYPKAQKVGFSLKIDDIPTCYKERDNVINWEQNWWEKQIESGIYKASIDTTFALYRPFSSGKANFVELNIRTDYPYQALHLPWYSDSENLTNEQIYYLNHCKSSTHWSAKTS